MLSSYMRLFADHHVTGIFAQSNSINPSVSLSCLRHYLLARLPWNPQQDKNALVREFVQNYYKEGTAAVMEYLELLKNTIASRNDLHTWIYESPDSIHLSVEFVRQAEQVFNKALASLPEGGTAWKRLKMGQLSISYIILEQWRNGRIQRSPQSILALLDDAEKGCAHSRIKGLTEHDWEEKVKKEWFRAMREKATGQLWEQSVSPTPAETAAAF